MNASHRVLVLAGILGACAADGAQTVKTEGWNQVTTHDFTVVSQMSAADTADWAGRLNQFLFALKGRIPVDRRLLGEFTLVVFSNASDFWASMPVLKNGDAVPHVSAFSRSGDWGSIAATSERGADEDTQRLIFGAGASWLMSGDHRYRPLALSQGLSEVYGAYVTENGSEVFGQPVRGWTSRLQRAEAHSLDNAETFLRIEDLLSVHDLNHVADVHGVPMFHVESWGFVHFLLFSKEMAQTHAMDKLLAAFAHHHDAHNALREAFGDDLGSLGLKFQAYIQGGDYYEITLPIETAPPTDAPVPADPARVAAILSRLEANVGHEDVARAYAQQAIQLSPGSPGPYEAMAFVEYREKRYAQVVANCKEAFRLGSRSGPTWMLGSLVVGRATAGDKDQVQLRPEQAREAVTLAEKAVLFHRGLEAAYVRIGALMPAVGSVNEDDGKFLALGRMLFPNNGWIEVGQAQWAHRAKDDAMALKILDDVQTHADAYTPQEVDKARMLRAEWTGHSG